MADALDMLGVAAVLVDSGGLALFANRRARGLFGPHLTIVDDRLKAGDAPSRWTWSEYPCGSSDPSSFTRSSTESTTATVLVPLCL